MKIIKLLIANLLLCTTCMPQKQVEHPRIVLAYVTSWSVVVPDPSDITHINYAFGHVNESFNGIMINSRNNPDGRATSEDRLKTLVALKEQKPSLKILLSIGGWGSGRFSEMATNETNRLAFANDCQRVVQKFGLDGIDMDWEYPTSSAAGISSSPDDMENFTWLMRDIRNAIGKDKLLTFASAANAQYVDFKAVEPYVDFVNIMTYDMVTNGSAHHAGMFRSELTGRGRSCEESVDLHVEAGIPIHKLVLGIPFYGRGRDSLQNFTNYRNLIIRDDLKGIGQINRRNLIHLKGHKTMWDAEAKAPYVVDAEEKFVLSYENPRSIAIKCEWLNQKGMLGAMYWEYAGDDDQGTLRKAVYDGVMSVK